MAWDLTLANMHVGTGTSNDNVADITDARDRKFTFQHRKPQTIEFTLDLEHPAMPLLVNDPHSLVKLRRDGALAMCPAEVTSIQLVGRSSERGVRVVATEAPWVRFAKRHVGKGVNGFFKEGLDRGTIVTDALGEINTEQHTQVRMGVVVASTTVAAGPFYFKPLLELVQELAAPLGGFDFWFDPADPDTDVNGAIGYLNIDPVRGDLKDDAVFEYGTGRANLAEYDWLINLADRITQAYSLPPGYPDNVGLVIKSATPTAAIETEIGRREAIVQSELADDDLRQDLVDEHVAIRENPRNVFLVQPAVDVGDGSVPSFLEDYDIGDVVPARINDEGLLILNGQVRIYGATVEPDDENAERVELLLVEEA